MAPESSVFISYSRRDYYFAESLAFHLLRRNVPAWMDVKDLKPGNDWERDLEQALDEASTLVLVASPHSVESERVRAEWRRALDRGCRIIVVRFRNATLPPELQLCDSVDFRGSFGRAMRSLMSRLAPDADGVSASRPAGSGWLTLPPWVVVMGVILAIPVVGYFAAANWTLQPDDEFQQILLLLMPLGALALAWFFCFAFLRRRMGMTRLAICLLCLAAVFAIPMLGYLFPRLSFLTTGEATATFSRFWYLGIALLAIPLAGLCILVLVRPEDLLRWTPTGKAWSSYRIGHVANAAFGRAELAFQFEQIRRFWLSHDPADTPMAQRLREHLVALGGSEASTPGESVTPVRLLTNRTQLDWIDAQTGHMRGEGVTVVGTRIDLPPSLDWLWRRQWIDFRGWDLRRSDRAQSLPQVPETVTQKRLPAIVARTHHVLCAIAALMFTLTGPLTPEETQQSADPTINDALSAFTFGAALWWGIIAHRLVRRTRPAPLLFRSGAIAAVYAIVVVTVDLYALIIDGKVTLLRAAVAAVLFVAALIWLLRQSEPLAFWLPESKPAGAARMALGNYRDWSTLIWLVVYAMAWMAILGLD